jgi:hypothetical protein
MRFRFYNDSHGTAIEPLVITGGQASGVASIALSTSTAGLTLGPSGAITSSSPSSSWQHTGNFTVQSGTISSSAGAGIAGPTNSGVNLNYGSNWGRVSLFDSTRAVDNRTAEWVFVGGNLMLRYMNDAYTSGANVFVINGGSAGVSSITSNSGSGAWTHQGNFSVSGTTTLTGAVSMPGGTNGPLTISQGYTVATLPTCNTASKGARAFVTDAASPTWNSPVTGGNSNTIPVFCNGNAWVGG